MSTDYRPYNTDPYGDDWGDGEVECLVAIVRQPKERYVEGLNYLIKLVGGRQASISYGVLCIMLSPKERSVIRERCEYFAGEDALFETIGLNRSVHTA